MTTTPSAAIRKIRADKIASPASSSKADAASLRDAKASLIKLRTFYQKREKRRFSPLRIFADTYRAQPLARIEIIKRGIAPGALEDIAAAMGAGQESVVRSLGIPKSTFARKRQQGAPLEKEQSELVVGLAKLIGQVQNLVEEQGNPEGFEAAKWFYKWADEGVPALGGRKPKELLDTKEGQQLVANLIETIRAGAYA